MKNIIYFLFLYLIPVFSSAQDGSEIIERLMTRMNRVMDYSVNAKIKSDIPLIKILTVNATIYFKQKDKFRIISKGIAILPKQGFTDITKILREKDTYSSILTGTEIIQNARTEIITILPGADTSDLILAKLWVDASNDLMLKSQITTRSSGTVTAEYKYSTHKEFGLPESMLFTMDVKKFKIPKGLATDINRTSDAESNKPVPKVGTVFIQLNNYVINKGINEDVFLQK